MYMIMGICIYVSIYLSYTNFDKVEVNDAHDIDDH